MSDQSVFRFVFLFALGVAIKFSIALLTPTPEIVSGYINFISDGYQKNILNPWIDSGLDDTPAGSFPYGLPMFFWFLPVGMLHDYAHQLYQIIIFLSDLIVFLALGRYSGIGFTKSLYYYWLSPVIVLSCYAYGFNDVVIFGPLLLSLFFLSKRNFFWSGCFLGLCCWFKVNLIILFPFFLIFSYQGDFLNRRMREFLFGFCFLFAFSLIQYVSVSESFKSIFASPMLNNFVTAEFRLGPESAFLISPMILIIFFSFLLKIKRFNFELFLCSLGISFFTTAVFTPHAFGWLVLCVPFFVLFIDRVNRNGALLYWLFNILFGLQLTLFSLDQSQLGLNEVSKVIFGYCSLASNTLFIAVSVIIILKGWKDLVVDADLFKLGDRRWLFAIAGDSGVGKDTLTNALIPMFGRDQAEVVHGDDYHRWDRQKGIWGHITHLNPVANNLSSMSSDILGLVRGNNVVSHFYNHNEGVRIRGRKLISRDFIFVNGLHALYPVSLRNVCDLRIFLDMESDLREALKIRRDVGERGKRVEEVLESIERRAGDRDAFILPQKNFADLIFYISASRQIDALRFSDKGSDILKSLKLTVELKFDIDTRLLVRTLVGICGLRVSVCFVPPSEGVESIKIEIEGDISRQDVQIAASRLCPLIVDILQAQDHFEEGIVGIMQLIVCMNIEILGKDVRS